MPLTFLWCLYCQLDFTHCFSVSSFNIEQVNSNRGSMRYCIAEKYREAHIIGLESVDPFRANISLLFPLKTLENLEIRGH